MEKDERRGRGKGERVERAYSREKRARDFDLVWRSGGRDRDEVKKRKRRRNRGEGEINEREERSRRGIALLSGVFTGIRDGIVACPVPMQS